MTGNYDSIMEFKNTLVKEAGVPEEKIEISGSGTNTTLAYCAQPKLCEFTAEPQYFPTVLKSRGPFLDYYPCLVSEKITPLAPPTDGKQYPTPYDLNVCIPTPPDDPFALQFTNNDYFECFQRIRPADGSLREASHCKGENDPNDERPKCKLVNILHEDYSNPTRQDTIYRTIVTNTFDLVNPRDPNYRAYQGSYCGHPGYRIINNTVNNTCSPEEAALACAQLGAYADSKYIAYGEVPDVVDPTQTRRYCNTFFDCRDFSPENRNKYLKESFSDDSTSDGRYFKSYTFGPIEKEYQSFFNPSQDDENVVGDANNNSYHYIYNTKCPPLTPIDPSFLPTGCSGPGCKYNNCPGDLYNIQSKGATVNNDLFFNTNACTDDGHIHRVSMETAGKYFSIELPSESRDDYRLMNLYPNNNCNVQIGPPQVNCFTAIQWKQLTTDYNFSLPLPDTVQNTIINSGDGRSFKLYRPTFNSECGNCSSMNGGIIAKTEILNVGGGDCNWSAHLGIDSMYCALLPNQLLIYRVSIHIDPTTKQTTITPTTDGSYTIRDNDYVIVLGDDGYGGNFTGLGSFCNQEWSPCLRRENAYVPGKRDDQGNLVPDWDSPDVHIDYEHGIFIITIEDDPYIYEEIMSASQSPTKSLRTDRAFSLRKRKDAEFFPGQYLKIDNKRVNCRDCSGSLIAMQFHSPNPDFDSHRFMETCTFLLSDTPEVVPPVEATLSKTIEPCYRKDKA
jgi:hypothetical protein